MNLREAAEQALYALELDAYGEPPRYERNEAIVALRAALAEPDEVAVAVAAEREACARVCDQRAKDYGYETDFYAHEHVAEALQCAALIRARGNDD